MNKKLETILRRLDAADGWKARGDAAMELLGAVDFPEAEEIVRVEDLSPEQHAVAEALGERSGVYIEDFAIPCSNRVRRRWLGLDPAGPLEKRGSCTVDDEKLRGPRWWVWRTLVEEGEEDEVEGLFDSAVERLEAYAELELADDEGYRLEQCLDVVDDLEAAGAEAAPWAKAFADELLELFAGAQRLPENGMREHLPDELKLAVFVPLALAAKPYQERWDALIPVTRNRGFMQAVAAWLPEGRREDLLLERLSRAMVLEGLDAALHVLGRFPSKRIAAWLQSALIDPATTEGLDREMVQNRAIALQQLGTEHPVIAEALAEAGVSLGGASKARAKKPAATKKPAAKASAKKRGKP